MNLTKLLLLISLSVLSIFWSNLCFAQNDTVVVKQGDRLVGEMQSLDHDILLFKTAYADAPVSLKWSEVIFLHSKTKFKLQHNNGSVFVGRIELDTMNKSAFLKIISVDKVIEIKRGEIQTITKFDKKLSDRLKIDADLGVVTTKANNSDQASLDLAVKYFAQRWEFDFDYAGYASTVDTIHTNRADLALTTKYNFPENWFLIVRLNSFTSTEQQIDYRVNYFAGTGKYILRGNKITLWGYAGGTYNREKFTISSEVFKTAEAFIGVHFEASLLKRLKIVSDFITYPSISDWGRIRLFSQTDIMVNFSTHFRFGLGYVINTDSKPPVYSSKSDYLFNAKLGWSL
jgi:Protein of unknown function, DUF481